MASKKIIFLIFFLGLIFVGLKAKVDFEKDLIWHLKENFLTKIVIFFKKTNIFYNHKIRKKIVLIQKNADEGIASIESKFAMVS